MFFPFISRPREYIREMGLMDGLSLRFHRNRKRMKPTNEQILTAFLLNIGAGLSTCIGGLIVFDKRLIHLANPSSLSIALGISAGVMIFISLVEIFNESVKDFQTGFIQNQTDNDLERRLWRNGNAQLLATFCFLMGSLMIFLIDFIVHRISPDAERQLNVNEIEILHQSISTRNLNDRTETNESQVSFDQIKSKDEMIIRKNLNRTGVLTALAILIHNIPEGIVTYIGTMEGTTLGVMLAISIALHNIPEGIAVAAPVYFATKSRMKAFLWTFLSALAEPLGGVICWTILHHTSNVLINGILFGLVAGMMVTISIKELIPTAHRYSPSKEKITCSILIGMFVMAFSLILFSYTVE